MSKDALYKLPFALAVLGVPWLLRWAAVLGWARIRLDALAAAG